MGCIKRVDEINAAKFFQLNGLLCDVNVFPLEANDLNGASPCKLIEVVHRNALVL